jgi:glycosyltransferase involved in cell wall biosynthesis
MIGRFPFKGSNFRVVHNGSIVPQRAVLEEVRQKVRKEWGVGEADIVIGSVGRIEAQKNPVGFVDAVAGLSAGDDVKCVWIGDGALRATMSEEARAKGISLHIDGWRQDVDQRLAGFDVFFLPSLFEGLPFAVLEAMHAGLPVVASEADGLGEALREGVSGFLCQYSDEFTDRLQRLVTDAALRTRMGQTARADARERFSLKVMASKTREIYDEAIANNANI